MKMLKPSYGTKDTNLPEYLQLLDFLAQAGVPIVFFRGEFEPQQLGYHVLVHDTNSDYLLLLNDDKIGQGAMDLLLRDELLIKLIDATNRLNDGGIDIFVMNEAGIWFHMGMINDDQTSKMTYNEYFHRAQIPVKMIKLRDDWYTLLPPRIDSF